MGRARQLASLIPVYARLGWWGLVAPRITEREPLVVVQALVQSAGGILLSVRSDLHGWELPGGTPRRGEAPELALRREIQEETGLEIEVERLVGEYVRTGFRPHRALVYAARVTGGKLEPSRETPRVAWFPLDRLPTTLFPWYRAPIQDGTRIDRRPGDGEREGRQAVLRHEHNGLAAVASGLWIDLRMRISDDRAR